MSMVDHNNYHWQQVGKKLQAEIARYIVAEAQGELTPERRARIAAFAAAGYAIERALGVEYVNPLDQRRGA